MRQETRIRAWVKEVKTTTKWHLTIIWCNKKCSESYVLRGFYLKMLLFADIDTVSMCIFEYYSSFLSTDWRVVKAHDSWKSIFIFSMLNSFQKEDTGVAELQHGGAIYLIGVVFFKLDGRLPLVNNSNLINKNNLQFFLFLFF